MTTSKPPGASPLARAYAVLANPTTFRNDLASLLAFAGILVSLFAPTWHMPIIPDAILGAGSFLLAVGVRVVHTLVDGKGLSADVAYMKESLPEVRQAIGVLLPFIEHGVPELKSTVITASANASKAQIVAAQALSVASQVEELKQPMAALQKLMNTSTAPAPQVTPSVSDVVAAPSVPDATSPTLASPPTTPAV